MGFGSLGVILVIGGLAAVAMGALKKFELDTEAEFKLGEYETEVGVEFEVDKDRPKRRGKKRKGRDRPNPKEQPNQIAEDMPMLVPQEDFYPYYNRFILY